VHQVVLESLQHCPEAAAQSILAAHGRKDGADLFGKRQASALTLNCGCLLMMTEVLGVDARPGKT
jgi:hypothetical protein